MKFCCDECSVLWDADECVPIVDVAVGVAMLICPVCRFEVYEYGDAQMEVNDGVLSTQPVL